MFKICDSVFIPKLEIKNTIDDTLITLDKTRYFDNDGFELSELEKEYYKANNVILNNCLNHLADQQDWFKCEDNNFFIDHSILVQRWQFVDKAREQISCKKTELPLLNKYLKLVPKWGIDFALEYYRDDIALEVIHIELDYRDYDSAVVGKRYVEEMILDTDWQHFVESLLNNKDQWQYLTGMEQNDWKAVHWGLQKAEKTYKAFL